MDLHFAWQAWHLWHWAGSGGALGSQLTPWTPRLFAWQAWRLATWIVTLRGRRGACGTGMALVARLGVDAAAFGVAGVALGDMDLHFAWQAWRFVTWTFTLRGRRGTCGTGLALVARLGLS